MNAHLHIGTCGWQHDAWSGRFYPEDLPRIRWLARYAHLFNTVEIAAAALDGEGAVERLGHWLAETPAHFRFAIKAPRSITHERRLRGCGEALAELLENLRPLHARMGPILFQLPRGFEPEEDGPALREFVRGLPHGWRFAVEFQDEAWHQPRFVKLLEEHRVSWAWTDRTSVADQDRAPFGFLPEPADFLYVRLLGDGEGRPRPRAVAIESWAVRLRKQAEHVKEIYLFCADRYEGFAPASCRAIGGLLGIDLPSETDGPEAPEGPRQMRLL